MDGADIQTLVNLVAYVVVWGLIVYLLREPDREETKNKKKKYNSYKKWKK